MKNAVDGFIESATIAQQHTQLTIVFGDYVPDIRNHLRLILGGGDNFTFNRRFVYPYFNFVLTVCFDHSMGDPERSVG